MNKILSKTYFSEKVVKLEVEAPLIAKARKPGNFVIVRVGEKGERMPLTIADANLERGSITLVVQVMGVSSRKLCALEVGDYITDLVGPLGKPTHIEKVGTVLACGGLCRWWCRRGSFTAHRAGFQGSWEQGDFCNCRT